MKNMFDEQQAMMMALDISGNHVMCLDLQQNRVFDLHGNATHTFIQTTANSSAPLLSD